MSRCSCAGRPAFDDDVFELGSLRVQDRKHVEAKKELRRRFRANGGDVRAVRRFAAAHRLRVLRVDAGRRVIVLRGRARQMTPGVWRRSLSL